MHSGLKGHSTHCTPWRAQKYFAHCKQDLLASRQYEDSLHGQGGGSMGQEMHGVKGAVAGSVIICAADTKRYCRIAIKSMLCSSESDRAHFSMILIWSDIL